MHKKLNIFKLKNTLYCVIPPHLATHMAATVPYVTNVRDGSKELQL